MPPKVAEFVRNNSDELRGVVVSGNRNFGEHFGKAGEIISREYNVPILLTFELSGTDTDVTTINEEVLKLRTVTK